MGEILESYNVGIIRVTKQELASGSPFWKCNAVLLRDTLEVISFSANVGHYIEHGVWQTGWSTVRDKLAVIKCGSDEARQQMEDLLPHLMRYIAHGRAAKYNEGYSEDSTEYTKPLEGLLKTVLDEVAKVPSIEFYSGELEKISRTRFVPQSI